MRWHVVRSFVVVLEVRRVFWDETIKEFFEIATSGRIGVFHDDEAATRVPNENSQCAVSDAAAGQDVGNLVGDFVGPFAGGPDGDRLGVDAQRRHFSDTLDAADRDAIRDGSMLWLSFRLTPNERRFGGDTPPLQQEEAVRR